MAAPNDEEHIVVGRRFTLEALRGGTVTQLYMLRGLDEKLLDLVELAEAKGVPLHTESVDGLDRRSGGARHQGVVAIGPSFPFTPLETFSAIDSPLLIALDEIQDPQNLGAILRSALAFGADGVIIPKHRAANITPAVVRASAGASERSAIARVTNLQRTLLSLAAEGREIVGLAADGDISIAELGPAPLGRVIVVGSEGTGLRRMVRERCTHLAAIPQLAAFDSLNASVASAIALYEAARAR